jgi:hypothetical protein
MFICVGIRVKYIRLPTAKLYIDILLVALPWRLQARLSKETIGTELISLDKVVDGSCDPIKLVDVIGIRRC